MGDDRRATVGRGLRPDACMHVHLRACLLGIALAGCSRGSSPPASLSSLIVPDATAFLAAQPTSFPLLAMFDSMPDMYRCWRTLESKLEGTYQVFVPSGGSYAILVGDLPRSEVERCAMQMLLSNQLATGAAETIANNAFAVPLEEHLGAAISKLPQTVTGTTLTLRFDQASFPGVELEKLQAWIAGLQAAAAR